MRETYTTKAVVINRIPFREHDSKVMLYSFDYGKLDLVARGTRKILSKLAGHLEPFSLVNVMVVPGRQFDYVGTATAEKAWPGIKADFLKLQVLGEFMAIFNKLIKPGVADIRLYNLLSELMANMENLGNGSDDLYKATANLYLLKLLKDLGYQPELNKCVACGISTVDKIIKFNPGQGGIVCAKCGELTDNNLLTLSFGSLNILKNILSNDIDLDQVKKINGAQVKEINSIISSFYSYHLS